MITAMVPEDLISRYLGSGLSAMLIMLAMGVPMYICATASTPIAAALILKGVSPGAALVFLLAGPATNITSLTVLTGILGRRATAIYLIAIAVSCIGFGLVTDQIYAFFNISAKALVGQASEFIPYYFEWAGTLLLILLSIKPVYGKLQSLFKGKNRFDSHTSENQLLIQHRIMERWRDAAVLPEDALQGLSGPDIMLEISNPFLPYQ
jgi:uncharacterized protein